MYKNTTYLAGCFYFYLSINLANEIMLKGLPYNRIANKIRDNTRGLYL